MNKETIKNLWNNIEHRSALHHAQLCILKAMSAKGKDKEAIAKHFIRKAFTPITRASKLANSRSPFDTAQAQFSAYRWGGTHSTILGVRADEILNEEELAQYNSISKSLASSRLVRRYSYFFTRQDIFDEYQLVQTAHAALELGSKLPEEQVRDLHFTCCGVADLEELEQVERVLDVMKVDYITFREPDIGNHKTSIATQPIEEDKRGLLRNYNLLRFDRNVTIREFDVVDNLIEA